MREVPLLSRSRRVLDVAALTIYEPVGCFVRVVVPFRGRPRNSPPGGPRLPAGWRLELGTKIMEGAESDLFLRGKNLAREKRQTRNSGSIIEIAQHMMLTFNLIISNLA